MKLLSQSTLREGSFGHNEGIFLWHPTQPFKVSVQLLKALGVKLFNFR